MSEAVEANSGLAQMRTRLSEVSGRLPKRTWPRPEPWVLVVVFVAVFTWSINPIPPSSGGYDISWITGLVVAAHRGMYWGSQFNYTYGPLAYLTIGNLFYDSTGIPADIVIGALNVGILVIVARPLCTRLGWVLGGLLVLVLARMASTPLDPVELVGPLITALGILALRRDEELRPVHAVGISVLAAFSCLDKLSVGPIGIAVVVVLATVEAVRPGVSRRDRLRGAVIQFGSFIVAVIFFWLFAGQSVFDLPAYIRNGFDFITGYDDAESLSDPAINWQYTWAAISAVFVAVAVYWTDRDTPIVRRVAIALLWLLFVYTEFRHAFVRLTPGHAALYFGPVALLCAAVLIRRFHWKLGLLACLVTLAGLWQVGMWNAPTLFGISTFPIVQNVNMFLSPNLRHGTQAQSEIALRASYGFPPKLISALTGHTVQFDPWEAAISWAYPQIRWDPAPVFQSYNAYTSHLDDLNAAFLAGPRAPRYILRQNVALDDRNPRFESPRYMLEMFCRYQEVMTITGWQLLEHAADRCGKPVPAGSQVVKFDRRVSVPKPTSNSIVVASFTDFSQPLLDTLAQLFFKRPIQFIAINQTYYRFVPGSASNPHVMSFPPCMNWSTSLIDPTPYTSIAIGHIPQLLAPGHTEPDYSYRVSFERIPFNCYG